MTILLCLLIILNRPYRTFSTNLLAIFAGVAFTQMMISMYMKVQGYRQSVFIDKYFFILICILNGICWLAVVFWFTFILASKQKWVIDREAVKDITADQDLAIEYIKDARYFINELSILKKYTDKDRDTMEVHIEKLSSQFNRFRGQKPLIMDSLLETIDSLRLIQKK